MYIPKLYFLCFQFERKGDKLAFLIISARHLRKENLKEIPNGHDICIG